MVQKSLGGLDQAGLTAASASNDGEFVRFSRDVASTPVERSETVIEVFDRIEILPGLILQQDVQYIINPSMDSELDNALQVGLRLEMSF